MHIAREEAGHLPVLHGQASSGYAKRRHIGLHVVSVLGFGLSAVLGVWLLWSVLRSGRL